VELFFFLAVNKVNGIPDTEMGKSMVGLVLFFW